MYPLDDDNLDRLSREAAEHFEAEAGASGWDHLEQRLNKELPQEKKRRRFLFWLLFITAVTGGTLTAILKYRQPATPLANNVAGVAAGDTHTNNPNPTISSNNNTPEAAEQKEGTQPATNRQEATTASTDTQTGASNNIPDNNQAATVTNKVTTPENSTTQPVEKTKGHTLAKPTGIHIQKAPATLNYATITPDNGANKSFNKGAKQKTGNRSAITTNQNNTTTSPVTENNTVEAENSNTNVTSTTTEKPVDASTSNEVATTQPAVTTQTDSTKNKPAATPAADSAKTIAQLKKKDDTKKDKIKQPLELGIIAGPDMSTVSFGPLYKPGYNFGVQVGYRFSNRWSVNAGAIYTKKFYKADSTNFHYKSTWVPRSPYNVEGNCSMWEIPVNVRYDVSFNSKRRWFVSTGLSTYLMDKENYDLYYWPGSSASYPLNSDTNSNYLFSIWNLSVGMERSLGKRFSLQAEPYLKVPLTGLGKGSMRMDSYGILFTLKYKPFLNTKKSK